MSLTNNNDYYPPSRTSPLAFTPSTDTFNLHKNKKSIFKRIRSLSLFERKINSTPIVDNDSMLGHTTSMPNLGQEDGLIRMQSLSNIEEEEPSTRVKRRPSLIKRMKEQFQKDDLFSVGSTPPVSRASTVSSRSVTWGPEKPEMLATPSRLVSPDLSVVPEESQNTLSDYFDATMIHAKRLIQGILYICNGYLLFNARQYDKIVARIQIDFEVLLAAEKQDWLGSPSAIWIAMLGGNLLLVNLRERDKCLESILQTWSRRLSSLHSLTALRPKITRSFSLGEPFVRRDTFTTVHMEPTDRRGSKYGASLPCRCNAHLENPLIDMELQANPVDLYKLIFEPSAFMSTFFESHGIRTLKTTKWIEIEKCSTRRIVQTFPRTTTDTSVDRLLTTQTLLVDSADLITVESLVQSSELGDLKVVFRWCMVKPPKTFNRVRLMLSMSAESENNHHFKEQFETLFSEDLNLLLRARFPLDKEELKKPGAVQMLHYLLYMKTELILKVLLIIALVAWITWMLSKIKLPSGSPAIDKGTSKTKAYALAKELSDELRSLRHRLRKVRERYGTG